MREEFDLKLKAQYEHLEHLILATSLETRNSVFNKHDSLARKVRKTVLELEQEMTSRL